MQTVRRDQNPLFHALISEFGRLTGLPVVVNTSFNVRDEPMVSTPEHALNTFVHAEIDFLMIGDALVTAESRRS